MMSKCANPGCSSTFRYLREGKLFQVPASDPSMPAERAEEASARDEFFWLCGECSKGLTIAVDPVMGVHIVPRDVTRALRAAG